LFGPKGAHQTAELLSIDHTTAERRKEVNELSVINKQKRQFISYLYP